MQTPPVPRVVRPGQNRAVAIVGHRYTYLATGEDTGNAYTLILADIPAGDPGPPPHTHHREDEGFYILDGQITFVVDGREFVASSGTFVFAPRGLPHLFRNSGPGPARMLVTVTPAGLERFFDEVGDDWTGRTDMPPPPTAEHFQKIVAAAPRYGLELHLPSPDA